MVTTTVGIDVGKNGAITFIKGGVDNYSVMDMPTAKVEIKKAVRVKDGVYKNGNIRYRTKTSAKYRTEIDFQEIYFQLKHFNRLSVFIEKQQCMPMNSTKSCSSAMYNYGKLIQLLDCLIYEGNNITYTIVPPKVWKAHFGLSASSYKENKDVAVDKAKELGFISDKKRADIYESYLIARYGYDMEYSK